MGDFKRIWSEGKLLGSIKSLYKESKGLCKGGGGFDRRVCGRTGSKKRVPLIPMAG